MPWYLFAIGSAIVWGIHYVILEQTMKNIHPSTALFITSISVIFLIIIYSDEFITDIKIISSLDIKEQLKIGALLFTGITATFCLYTAIHLKSASHAALLEMTYPIFVILLSYIFLQTQLSLTTLIGGILIFSGAFLITIKG